MIMCLSARDQTALVMHADNWCTLLQVTRATICDLMAIYLDGSQGL